VIRERASRKSLHADNHEMHAALVQPAGREQVLKLAAISRLGALPFLVKAFEIS
jgi:hypothetical protein